MKIIKEIRVQGFRSIRDDILRDVGDFSVLVGINNAGKSNFLKSLNLFFNEQVEEGDDFEITRDYFRHDRAQGRKQRVRVTCTFELPSLFNFRTDLSYLEEFLGRNFRITKEWDRNSSYGDIYLNDDSRRLGGEDVNKINIFLNLINFRYIPNRVIPIFVLRQIEEELRDVLLRRLSFNKERYRGLFDDIAHGARELSKDVSDIVGAMIPDIENIRLSTASSLADLILNFAYLIREGDVEIDQEQQGSGLQSILMLQTLHLIDTDFSKSFGWKQAAVWAVEEPESSLHTKLEAEVGAFLRRVTCDEGNRLQTIATTHSDLIIQYADAGYYIERRRHPLPQSPISTKSKKMTTRELLANAAKFGVSRWVNPVLYYPLDPLVLVEGVSDKEFILECFRVLKIRKNFRLETLADLKESADEGGIDRLIRFLKENIDLIRARNEDAPVILIGDWDARDKVEGFRTNFQEVDTLKVMIWDERRANPNLDESFRGVERFYADRLVEAVEVELPDKIATTNQGRKQILPQNYSVIKKELRKIVREGLLESDIAYARSFIEELYTLASDSGRRDLYY